MFQLPPLDNEDQFEDFICDLFNLEYDTDSFQRYGSRGHKQKGIDIYSAQNRIVIQCKKKEITRNAKSLITELIDDIEKDVDTTLNESLNIPFDRFILVSTFKNHPEIQEFAASLKRKKDLRFEVEYWGWNTITKKAISHQALLEKYFPIFMHGKKRRDLTFFPSIDLKGEIFGRKDDVKEIFSQLTDNNSLLIINGLGGIGKSVVAKAIAEKYKDLFSHRVWVEIQSDDTKDKKDELSFTSALINNYELISNLNLRFPDTMDSRGKFNNILYELNQLEGPNLMVIDNANRSISKFIPRLTQSSNWIILFTSREKISGVTEYELDTLELDSALKLFYTFYQIEKNDDVLIKILDAIEFHTLTIELLAKTGNKRHLTIEELGNSILDNGLKLPKTSKVVVGHDPDRTPIRLFEYLLKIFSIANLTDSQKDILRNFSIFPTSYVKYSLIIELLDINEDSEDNFFDDLNELVEKGWLIRKNNDYRIHQVIQEVAQSKLSPDYKSCSIYINSLNKNLHYTYDSGIKEAQKYIDFASKVIQYLSLKEDSIVDAVYTATLGMYSDLGIYEKSLKLGQSLIDEYKTQNLSKDTTYALICYQIGMAHRRLDNLEKALWFFMESEKYINKSHPQLPMIYSSIGIVYNQQEKHDKGLRYKFKALKVYKESGSDVKCEGVLYANIALSYRMMGMHEKAIEYSVKCVNYHKNTLDPNTAQFAIPYCNLAMALYDYGIIDAAKANMDKGIDIFEQNGFREHPDYQLFKPIQEEINQELLFMKMSGLPHTKIRFSMERNEICYCGSEKKYKNCCGK